MCGLIRALWCIPKPWLALMAVEERSGARGMALFTRSGSLRVGCWFWSAGTRVLSCLGYCWADLPARGRSVEVEPREEGSG